MDLNQFLVVVAVSEVSDVTLAAAAAVLSQHTVPVSSCQPLQISSLKKRTVHLPCQLCTADEILHAAGEINSVFPYQSGLTGAFFFLHFLYRCNAALMIPCRPGF